MDSYKSVPLVVIDPREGRKVLLMQSGVKTALGVVRIVPAFQHKKHFHPLHSIGICLDVGCPVSSADHWIRSFHQAAQGNPAPVVGVRFSVS